MNKTQFTKNILSIIKTSFFVAFILPISMSIVSTVRAVGEINTSYSPLVLITGLTDTQTTNADIGPYISGAYKWIISLSIALAFVMFTYYAFQYLLSESSIGNKSKAKEGMQNVLIGLLLVFSAWLILNTINPQLVALKLDIAQPAPVASFSAGAGGTNQCPGATGVPTTSGVYYRADITCYMKGAGGLDVEISSVAYAAYSGGIGECQKAVLEGKLSIAGHLATSCMPINSTFLLKQSVQETGSTFLLLSKYDDFLPPTQYFPAVGDGWPTQAECELGKSSYGITDVAKYCKCEQSKVKYPGCDTPKAYTVCSVVRMCVSNDGLTIKQ